MTTGVELDRWIEKVKRCEYLAEEELKGLCDYVRTANAPGCWRPLPLAVLKGLRDFLQVKEILVEESNVQPVNAPVTVSSAAKFVAPQSSPPPPLICARVGR